jgi:hypothetical protein
MDIALVGGQGAQQKVACPLCTSMLANENSLASHKSRYHRADGGGRALAVSVRRGAGDCIPHAVPQCSHSASFGAAGILEAH